MSHDLSRRQFVAAASAMAFVGSPAVRSARGSTPSARIIETKVISWQPEYYCGWPTVARRSNGQLVLVYSGGREAHVCPFGRVEMMVSNDEGATWTFPRIVLDGDIDDRDAGVLETAKGTLLVTTFTSTAYNDRNLQPELKRRAAPGGKGTWDEAKLKRWLGVHNRVPEGEHDKRTGQWMLRSTDGGRTFSPPIASIVNSPHGPCQLADGRLLYAGKELWTGQKRVGFAESSDDGQTWTWLATLPAREGDDPSQYHELHAIEAPGTSGSPGRIICHIRNHNKADAQGTLQSESEDGGRTWSTPRAITYGLPSHLLRLKDGRLVMSYGHRRKPFGNQARVSSDAGRTWSEPIIVSGDGIGGDLGYPSTVQLSDDSLLTVWYEKMENSPNAVLRQARWTLGA